MKHYEIKLDSIFPSRNKSDYFPEYIFENEFVKINVIYFFYYKVLLSVFKFFLKWRLKILGSSYKKNKDIFTHEDVEYIYTREARNYEYKHHLTTNFRDTWWRRQIGLEIINYIFTNNKKEEKIKILDIGTGAGLSLEEMFKIFKLFNFKVSAVGLDYNKKMLEQAKQITLPRMIRSNLLEEGIREAIFFRGDARNLTKKDKKNKEELEYFQKDYFDCVTVMFGIGGVVSKLESIKEQLSVLKISGILAITDIHRPIIKLKEKWPWFIGNKNAEAFSVIAWEKITKPLILGTLWGWKDPTQIFYAAPLIVDYDNVKNIYYGFELISLFFDNEFWWFDLPVMPTAKIVLKKIKITKEEFEKRNKILDKICL